MQFLAYLWQTSSLTLSLTNILGPSVQLYRHGTPEAISRHILLTISKMFMFLVYLLLAV